MQVRALLTMVVGIAFAGSAVAYTHAYIKLPGAQQPMQDVVVAVDDIAFGHVINTKKLAVQSWPVHAVPNGSFSSLDSVIGDGEGEQRRAKYALAKGDIIFASKISDFGEPVSITQKINPFMRAVTIRVNDVTGVAGLISPADRIDLTLTRSIDQQLVTSTILQDIEVLGIDQQSQDRAGEAGKTKTVTVQVDPVDAQKLALAQQAGTLSLSLRHIDAADRPELKSISVKDLTSPAKVAPKQKRPQAPKVFVNRRGERSTVEVPSS